MRIVIVSENVSMQMGGEASLPFYYFKLMRKRGHDIWVACHARVKRELREAFADDGEFDRIHFVEDTWFQVLIWRCSRLFPYRIKDLIFGQWIHLVTMRQLRRLVKRLVAQQAVQLILEPAPITPKGLSFMYRMGVPVVIGPLCGGLNLPPAFQDMDSRWTRLAIRLSRFLSPVLHRIFPGKLQADSLIVANRCTAKALPAGCRGRLYEVVESGVDLAMWQPVPRDQPAKAAPLRFVYSGRLVDWKGVRFLIEAFQQVAARTNGVLEVIGDGELRGELEKAVATLGLQDRVVFHGWLTRQDSASIIAQCDVFLMPSLRECGGTAILEAMAMGLPVICARWAGPAHYVDASCGILVEPTSRAAFIQGLAAAMGRLAESAELRRELGCGGRRRVATRYFDWESKTERILEILQETLARAGVQDG